MGTPTHRSNGRAGRSQRQPATPRTVAALGAILLVMVAVVAVGGTPPAALAAEDELNWEASDCRFIIVLVPTSEETVRPHVPAGFTPTVPDEVAALLPPDPRLEAVFGYEVFRCGSHTVGDDVATDATYASLWTFVEPPAELADPDYPLSFIKWTTFVSDDEQRSTLARRGVAVTDGTLDADTSLVTPAAALYDVTFTLDADSTYRTTGISPNPTEFAGRFVEYSPLADRPGFSLWRTDYTTETAFGGVGVAQWHQDSLASEILGTTEAQAYILAGDGLALTDASIAVRPGASARERG